MPHTNTKPPTVLGAPPPFSAGTYFLFLAKKGKPRETKKKAEKRKQNPDRAQRGVGSPSLFPFRCSFLFSKVSEWGEAKSDSRVNKFCVWKLCAQGQKDICLAPSVFVCVGGAWVVCRKCSLHIYTMYMYLGCRLPNSALVLVLRAADKMAAHTPLPFVGHFAVRVRARVGVCVRQTKSRLSGCGLWAMSCGFSVLGFWVRIGLSGNLELEQFG